MDGSSVRTSKNSADVAGAGSGNGGYGGQGNSNRAGGDDWNYSAGGGAGNPGGYNETAQHQLAGRAPTGTGGLMIIYAGTFNNNNLISSEGANGGYISSSYAYATGGSSGGGSINIFYKALTEKGSNTAKGGSRIYGSHSVSSGAGGSGSITYTQID